MEGSCHTVVLKNIVKYVYKFHEIFIEVRW